MLLIVMVVMVLIVVLICDSCIVHESEGTGGVRRCDWIIALSQFQKRSMRNARLKQQAGGSEIKPRQSEPPGTRRAAVTPRRTTQSNHGIADELRRGARWLIGKSTIVLLRLLMVRYCGLDCRNNRIRSYIRIRECH